MPPHHGEASPHEREAHTVPDQVPPDCGFDSTLGFPGEGPPAIIATPWFLAAVTTRELIESKRRKLDGVAATPVPTDRRLDFGPTASQHPRGTARAIPGLADTALGRFLKAQRGRAPSLPGPSPDGTGATPVPHVPHPTAPAFACLRELQDFRNPLPPVPAGESLRRTFICHFGGLHGMDAASFEEVWKAAKNGYNKAQDAHFLRFHGDFVAHSKASKFYPMGINPGDLVGFLRRERERGASHPTLKDASASVSSACAQASDGQVQLGSQDSVIRFLKMAKQSEAPTAWSA